MEELSSKSEESIYAAALKRTGEEAALFYEESMLSLKRAAIAKTYIDDGTATGKAEVLAKAHDTIHKQLCEIVAQRGKTGLAVAEHQRRLNIFEQCKHALIAEQTLIKTYSTQDRLNIKH